MSASLTLFISDVQVEIAIGGELAEVRAALAEAWAPCRQPLLAPQRSARFEAVAGAGGFAVHAPDAAVRAVELREDVLPVLESALYAAIPGWLAGQLLLHAACVTRGDGAVLLVGQSGAGKSSLALAALRRGFGYFSDELSVTDGARLWGIPRAVQFEPTSGEQPLPPWLQGVSLEPYRLRLHGGRIGRLPLFVPAPDQLARSQVPARRTYVVAIERAAHTELAALPPLTALGLLHEAAFRTPDCDLGALVGPGRAASLRWHDPDAAIAQLDAWLTAQAV